MDDRHRQISVVICTWNRAALLQRTLAQFARLAIPEGLRWELLIVDNRCTDETDAVIEAHSPALPIRKLREEKPGLSNARNRALGEARGELIVWTDDDVLVDPGWLAAYWNASQAWPAAAFFGGTVDPDFETPPSRWMRDNAGLFAGPFVIRQFGDEVRPLRPGERPFGASMAFRRCVFDRLAFDPALGRIGFNLLSGEETALIDALTRGGERGVWVGDARLRHWVPTKRTTRAYLWRWFVADGRSSVRAQRPIGPFVLGMPRWAIRKFAGAMAGTLFVPWAASARRARWWRDWAFASGVLLESRRTHRRPPQRCPLADPLPG